MIDGMGFILVPWRPVIEQRLGQQLAAMVRGGGVSLGDWAATWPVYLITIEKGYFLRVNRCSLLRFVEQPLSKRLYWLSAQSDGLGEDEAEGFGNGFPLRPRGDQTS